MDEREDAQGSRGTPTQRKRTSTAAENSDGEENSDGVEEEVRPPAPQRQPK